MKKYLWLYDHRDCFSLGSEVNFDIACNNFFKLFNENIDMYESIPNRSSDKSHHNAPNAFFSELNP